MISSTTVSPIRNYILATSEQQALPFHTRITKDVPFDTITQAIDAVW
jgi:hypothetical protein